MPPGVQKVVKSQSFILLTIFLIYLSSAKVIVGGFTMLFIILPFLTTIVCNCIMLYYSVTLSQKHKDASYKGALITVLSLCGMFTISVTPYMIRVLLHVFNTKSPVWLDIVQAHFYLINASCNSILYSITNRRFKRFIVKNVSRVFCKTYHNAQFFNNAPGNHSQGNITSNMVTVHNSSLEMYAVNVEQGPSGRISI